MFLASIIDLKIEQIFNINNLMVSIMVFPQFSNVCVCVYAYPSSLLGPLAQFGWQSVAGRVCNIVCQHC